MRVWLIITLFGQVANVTGPLPYDYARCLRLASEQTSILGQRFEADEFIKAPPAKLRGKVVTRADIAVECRTSDDRPKVEVELPGS
ncbi:hypothetical protein ACVIGB_000920 [Bradyrhizobium sp. USDA 4341]